MTEIKKRTRGRAALATGVGALAATGSLTFATASSFAASVGRHSHPHDATVVFTPTWQKYVDVAAPIAMSSPVLADLEGTPVAVVGDLRGYLYALNLADGEEIPNWPVRIGNIPIQSSPSVNGSTVYVGAGSAADPDAGGYYAFRGNGTLLWHKTIRYTPSMASTRGVEAGLAVGDLQGSTAVVGGSLGH
jgi:outer membrane protein assembly factor BamB